MSKKSIDEEGMGPLERGRGRYQRKDYKGALEAFTQVRALSLQPPDTAFRPKLQTRTPKSALSPFGQRN
jgi:hypothetical protein